jgi:hypothetical protein
MGLCGQLHAPAALPPGKTRYPLYRRRCRPQGRYGQVRKISPPPGFDPQTVQPLAIRYTDCAILARFTEYYFDLSPLSHIPAQFSVNKQWPYVGRWDAYFNPLAY